LCSGQTSEMHSPQPELGVELDVIEAPSASTEVASALGARGGRAANEQTRLVSGMPRLVSIASVGDATSSCATPRGMGIEERVSEEPESDAARASEGEPGEPGPPLRSHRCSMPEVLGAREQSHSGSI